VPLITLPPADAPLAPVLPALVDAARRGDVGAKCRLSFELQRCTVKLEAARRSVEQITDELLDAEQQGSGNGMLDFVAKQTEERDAIEKICAGASFPGDLKPWRLLLEAARAGHVPSMRRFALNMPFDSSRYFSDLEPFAAYRDEAPGLLLAAAEAGDPNAALALYSAYSGTGFSQVSRAGIFPLDRTRALAYIVSLRGLGDAEAQKTLRQQEARLRRKLPPAEQALAEQSARRMASRYAGWEGPPLDLMNKASKSAEECN
jgi:hypothetical protein